MVSKILAEAFPGLSGARRVEWLYASPSERLLVQVEQLRIEATQTLDAQHRAASGQFFTPASVAKRMAAMLTDAGVAPHILDAGAGVGSLFAACVAMLCACDHRPASVRVTAFEVDPRLARYARTTLHLCEQACLEVGIAFAGEVIEADFLERSLALLGGDLFAQGHVSRFTVAILNPPYRKIQARSRERRLLRQCGIETTNLYTGFLALAMRLLAPDGALVAITPRSFCNGVYFKDFRRSLLSTMTLRALHLFESRQAVFGDEIAGQQVLQESLILSAIKRKYSESQRQAPSVRVASSGGADDAMPLIRDVPYEQVVRPDDPYTVIHISSDELGSAITKTLASLPCTLGDLGLSASTGRVVDFRARAFLRQTPAPGVVPLVYPASLTGGKVIWPISHKNKPSALIDSPETRTLLIPNETYVLVKRFSSKEEKRRIVATVYEGGRLPGASIGFENHLNYFHRQGKGIDLALARGLAAYLGSSLVDIAFRQFSGHTQVNATDLRSLRYPTHEQLMRLGERVGDRHFSQAELDALIGEELVDMADSAGPDPIKAKQRIEEAEVILKALGFPRSQQNERSALTLLALLDLNPDAPWASASAPLRGVTPLMEFFTQYYGKTYAPNTRETVRRQTIHQFLDAALVRINPDDPNRPVNSGQTVYQIEANALALLQMYGSTTWAQSLERYLSMVKSLKERYAQERLLARIPLHVAPGKTITMSPGGQNVLIERIVHEFAERFTPGSSLVYVGDADEKFAYFDEELLASLSVHIDAHGKMPDVIIYDEQRSILTLIEAVTSHGPISAKRKGELERLFSGCAVDIVFVTAFSNRKAMTKYIGEIAWETEVWLADSPDHIIRFDGEHLPAPYQRRSQQTGDQL